MIMCPEIHQLCFRKLKAIGHNPVRMMRTWRLNLEPGSAEMPLRDFNQTFATGAAGWLAPTSYMNPRVFRLNAEFAF